MAIPFSLFHNKVWIEKHFDSMPKKLYLECSQEIDEYDSGTIGDKVWTAYVRSPNYLINFVNNFKGQEGVRWKNIPKDVKEYYDWLYAPLIQIKPELEQNLKKILFSKNLNEGDGENGKVDRYYWSIKGLRDGGAKSLRKLPSLIEYQYTIVSMLPKYLVLMPIFNTKKLPQTQYQHLITQMHNELGIHLGNPKHLGFLMRGNNTSKYKPHLENIIKTCFIPMQPHKQTGFKKWAFKNTKGFIPLFAFDFRKKTDFLNWVMNPFA